MTAALDWERAHHGPNLGFAEWSGHCNGAAVAGVLRTGVLHTISVERVNGEIRRCTGSGAGCIELDPSALGKLAAEAHVDAGARAIGGRCTVLSKPDAVGRYTGPCAGVNPGSVLMLALGYLRQGQRFAANLTRRSLATEIHQRTIHGLRLLRMEWLTESAAARLVGGKDAHQYLWNPAAHGWVHVEAELLFTPLMDETDPSVGELGRFPLDMVIELSAPRRQAEIVGGEYVGHDRLQVPTLLWVPTSPEEDNEIRNPFVAPSLVTQLLDLAQAG
jgi:hypothetical protein